MEYRLQRIEYRVFTLYSVKVKGYREQGQVFIQQAMGDVACTVIMPVLLRLLMSMRWD